MKSENMTTLGRNYSWIRFIGILTVGLALYVPADAQPKTPSSDEAPAQGTETIVCIRHGEKPKGGLGQLTCQGLNRALALPDVLLAKFGRPDFVFAPNPTQKADGKTGYNSDEKTGYNYIRPLMTIEPTAIRCGLPVNTEFGFKEIKGLEAELKKPTYQNATIFVAWEHGLLDGFARNMVKDNGGDSKQVPGWPGNDYDTIFVFKIRRAGEHSSLDFSIDHEQLNGLSSSYPKVAHGE
jgi:hypothetical protein